MTARHAVDISPTTAALAISTWHERVALARAKLPHLVTESDRPENDDRAHESKHEHSSNYLSHDDRVPSPTLTHSLSLADRYPQPPRFRNDPLPPGRTWRPPQSSLRSRLADYHCSPHAHRRIHEISRPTARPTRRQDCPEPATSVHDHIIGLLPADTTGREYGRLEPLGSRWRPPMMRSLSRSRYRRDALTAGGQPRLCCPPVPAPPPQRALAPGRHGQPRTSRRPRPRPPARPTRRTARRHRPGPRYSGAKRGYGRARSMAQDGLRALARR